MSSVARRDAGARQAGARRRRPHGGGTNLVHAAVVGDPARPASRPSRWPERLEGFEDLAFLFSLNQLNHGIGRCSSTRRRSSTGSRAGAATRRVVEIGRFKGGRTFLLASALPEGAELWSYDVHVPLRAGHGGPQLDRSCVTALERYGLSDRVHLVVADSRTVEPPPRAVDLILIDGDHSYDAVRADWEHWSPLVAPGGHVLFHDAVDTGGYGKYFPGVGRLVGGDGAGRRRSSGSRTPAGSPTSPRRA